MAKAVIATIGHDRPGLVSEITALAHRASLNIEDSRMTVLGGEFAMLIEITGSDADLTAFRAALEARAGDDFAFIYRSTTERTALAPSRAYLARIVAFDHPGIVAAIAGFFSARQINIRDLVTDSVPAPHTGTPMFNVTLTVEVPAALKVHELRAAFAEFCIAQDLDGELDPA